MGERSSSQTGPQLGGSGLEPRKNLEPESKRGPGGGGAGTASSVSFRFASVSPNLWQSLLRTRVTSGPREAQGRDRATLWAQRRPPLGTAGFSQSCERRPERKGRRPRCAFLGEKRNKGAGRGRGGGGAPVEAPMGRSPGSSSSKFLGQRGAGRRRLRRGGSVAARQSPWGTRQAAGRPCAASTPRRVQPWPWTSGVRPASGGLGGAGNTVVGDPESLAGKATRAPAGGFPPAVQPLGPSAARDRERGGAPRRRPRWGPGFPSPCGQEADKLS